MADPQHVEPLTSFDRGTVGLYRAGLVVSALAVSWLAFALWTDRDPTAARWATLLGAGLIVANLHLYDPRIRWFIGISGWLGAVLGAPTGWAPASVAPWLGDAGLGFLFVVFSATALKERLCFRLPIVVLVPPVLASALVPLRFGALHSAAALLGLGAGVLVLLAVAKLRMPLHYDIGDKSKYQV